MKYSTFLALKKLFPAFKDESVSSYLERLKDTLKVMENGN
jgi:hypothetical protein